MCVIVTMKEDKMKKNKIKIEDDKLNEINAYNESIFENIKHIDENNNEYWLARKLQKELEYSQ